MDGHQQQQQHSGSCNCICKSANPAVQQTLDEMEFERGIWTAAMDNELDRVEGFIRAGKVNAKDNFGYTAIHYAARSGHIDICRRLLSGGAEVDAQTKSGGVTPLQRAAMRGRLGVVSLLVECGRANVKAQDADGKTALHRAVEGDYREVVEYLLARDQTLAGIEDHRQQTPKDLAEERGNLLDLFTTTTTSTT